MDENNLFLKTIEQKYERFEDYYTLMSSDFLSLEQQSMLSGFMRAHSRDGVFFTEDTMMQSARSHAFSLIMQMCPTVLYRSSVSQHAKAAAN